MTEPENTPRRRERVRAPRSTAFSLPPRVPARLENPFPPVELYSPADVERIVDAAYTILERGGVEFLNATARAHLRGAGADVNDETGLVRLPRQLVRAACATAPTRFVLHARNPERHLHVGGNVVNFGPVNGAPNVTDLERGRRYGDIAAFRDLLKITHAFGVLHWQGGLVLEPVDLPVPERHLAMYEAHIACADTVWAGRGIGAVQARDAIALSVIEHRTTPEALAERPTLLLITNVNSPRRVDGEILEGIMAMAEAGQCVCITPFTLMGAMAPVTLPGALAQQTAEALAVIALVQIIRPGCPSVIGGFTSNVDMRTGSPAFGTPEYVHATLAGAQIARHLRIPYRSSAVNASPAADAQATWETGFSLWASIMSHSHLINHACGWLEGGLSASFANLSIDAEMLRGWSEILRRQSFSDDDLAVDAICEVPPGGHFFGAAHTLARYESAFWRPMLSDWSNFENWRDAGAKDATMRAHELWKKALAAYQAPPLDPAVREAVDDYIARRRLELAA
jgi:trimethylamine---corrinoid protein Co-methyltransferase